MNFDVQDNWSDVPDFLVPGISWKISGNNPYGYVYTYYNGQDIWNIRLNDFPDEPMFSLIVNSIDVIHFNEWPSEWGVRPKLG